MSTETAFAQIRALRRRRHNVRPRELERLALAAGWEFDHSTGSHAVYVKEGFWANLSVPQHRVLKGNLVLRLLGLIEASLLEEIDE